MDRQSCYICKFNNIKRVGDVSIGDFWGIEKYEKKYNRCKLEEKEKMIQHGRKVASYIENRAVLDIVKETKRPCM